MKKIIIRISCVISGFILFLLFLFLLCTIYCFFVPIKIDDIDKYLETDGLKSNLIIFPDITENKGEILEYHYYDYLLRDGSEIILSVKYDDASFEAEFSRLSLLIYTVFDYDPQVLAEDKNKELFNYYTLVAEYKTEFKKFEYVCFDFDNNIIHYIRLDYINLNYISIDHSLLPKYYFNNDIYSKYIFNIYGDPSKNNWL